jgi:hypothetical protein
LLYIFFGSGAIDLNELKLACASLGLDQAKMIKLFHEFDKDQTGAINMEEWKLMLKECSGTEIAKKIMSRGAKNECEVTAHIPKLLSKKTDTKRGTLEYNDLSNTLTLTCVGEKKPTRLSLDLSFWAKGECTVEVMKSRKLIMLLEFKSGEDAEKWIDVFRRIKAVHEQTCSLKKVFPFAGNLFPMFEALQILWPDCHRASMFLYEGAMPMSIDAGYEEGVRSSLREYS